MPAFPWVAAAGPAPASAAGGAQHFNLGSPQRPGVYDPSWKFGTGPSAKIANSEHLVDKFSFFDEPETKTHIAAQSLTTEEKKAYALLELEPGADEKAIKKKYNELAKKLHPDYNRSDPDAEDRLKEINLAYAVLRKNTQSH